jgi:hypothetical protein
LRGRKRRRKFSGWELFEGNKLSQELQGRKQASTAGGRLAAEFGSNERAVPTVHYLALLERKPGGFDFAKPLADWQLPVEFGILRRLHEAESGSRGTRDFIKVLRILEQHSLPALRSAVQTALELGTTGAEAVRLIVEARTETPVGLFSLDGRPQLKLVRVEQTDVSAYQSLLAVSVPTEVTPC